MSKNVVLPKLISVPAFGKMLGISRSQAYSLFHKLPIGVRVKIGGRVLVNHSKAVEWLDKGGDIEAEKRATRKKVRDGEYADGVLADVERRKKRSANKAIDI